MMQNGIQTLPLSTRFVCAWRSLSTNSWVSLFLLLECIHTSIDQQCSQAHAEHMTSETLNVNQTRSLKMGCPVLLSVTPSRKVSVHVAWGSFIISDVNAPWAPSFISSSRNVVHIMLSVVIDKVMRNLMWCRYWHTHLLGAHSIHKHGIAYCDFIMLKSLYVLCAASQNKQRWTNFRLTRWIWTVYSRVRSRVRRASPPSVFTLVLRSIYHGCSGRAQFTCLDKATIPRVWIGKLLFGKHHPVCTSRKCLPSSYMNKRPSAYMRIRH